MPTDFSHLLIGIALGGIFAYLLLFLHFHRKLAAIKKKSVSQSRSSILGEVSEKVMPLLPEFPYHTKDLVFLGKGVDYVVFDGLSRGKLKEIIFLEIKSGASQLNSNEMMIRNYLSSCPVRYEVMRVKY
ncbi:MAG: Holliday junction resolvase [candidate division SR1 bacterium]|nr:MAG: Holliday junction resolvase [candidate division SR1 bacterium]